MSNVNQEKEYSVDNSTKIRAFIKKKMDDKGIKQGELAKALKKTQGSISKMLNPGESVDASKTVLSRQSVSEVLAVLDIPVEDLPLPKREYRTLCDFPEEFENLTIVVGDRRETLEPKSKGDLFALSASPLDIRGLFNANLPEDVELVSDKIFVNAPNGYLKERFENRNLMIVGSPATNHLARIVNKSAPFHFYVESEVAEKIDDLTDEIKQIDTDQELHKFWNDAEKQGRLKHYMSNLMATGFVDPSKDLPRSANYLPPNKDYGLVTIAQHPYADADNVERVAILVAGVHLPGTMRALEALVKGDKDFSAHPFGGIFKITIFTQERFEKRFIELPIDWSSEEYDGGEELFRRYVAIEKKLENGDLGFSLRLDEVKTRKEFLARVVGI